MHPAYSVILFTTASGAGYGLIFWLALAHLSGAIDGSGWMPVSSLTIGLLLVTAGLLSSTAHLGHPERALRAFSQWRSSWLSREGVAAVATYIPAGLLWLCWLAGWGGEVTRLLALLTVLGAGFTVYCTGMIYASLRTIRQWHRWDVPVIYLAIAATTGLVLFLTFHAVAYADMSLNQGILMLACLAASAYLKQAYWRGIAEDDGQYTVDQALGFHGKTVRQLDPPHTMPNFVMREMGYVIARRHALKLHLWTWILLFVAPAGLIVLAVITGAWAPLFATCAMLSMAGGVFAERWLFFAEAEHVSMLYYGTQRA